MKNREIIFVSGVHGVGKGTLCRKLVSIVDLVHLSASDLIRRRKELDKNKKVLNAVNNQEILVQELNALAQHKKLLLDGHFCLIDTTGNIIKLPIELYERLNISKIILLKSEANTIYQQLLTRDSDDSGLNVQNIIDIQEAEIQHAYHVAKNLNIPILEINLANRIRNDEIQKVLEFI